MAGYVHTVARAAYVRRTSPVAVALLHTGFARPPSASSGSKTAARMDFGIPHAIALMTD